VHKLPKLGMRRLQQRQRPSDRNEHHASAAYAHRQNTMHVRALDVKLVDSRWLHLIQLFVVKQLFMVEQLFMVKQFIIFILGSRVGDPEARMIYRPADYVIRNNFISAPRKIENVV
jgi:hypothetical protein